MKFGQQFEINELYVCTQFRGNRSRDFGFRTRKPPRKFGVKSRLSQKRLKYGKKYFIGLYVSRYPFIPTNPLLAVMRLISFFFLFFFLFSFFFFLIFVRSSSPKPQHIEIYFLCKVVELQMQFFLPKLFGATPPGTIPVNIWKCQIGRFLTSKFNSWKVSPHRPPSCFYAWIIIVIF